jgi:hypothetical protein
MNYSKPEIAVLGPASLLVKGGKNGSTEPDQERDISDCEFDD